MAYQSHQNKNVLMGSIRNLFVGANGFHVYLMVYYGSLLGYAVSNGANILQGS